MVRAYCLVVKSRTFHDVPEGSPVPEACVLDSVLLRGEGSFHTCVDAWLEAPIVATTLVVSSKVGMTSW